MSPTEKKTGKRKYADPFKGRFTKLSAIPDTTVIPNEEGTDLYTKDESYDAHIRLETAIPTRKDLDPMKVISVDVFNSRIKDADKAHTATNVFPNNEEGAQSVVMFLKRFGFNYKIIPAN